MSTHYRRAIEYFHHALGSGSAEGAARRLDPQHHAPPPHVPGGSVLNDDALARRWALLPIAARAELADARTLDQRLSYEHNVENFIGTVKVPVGLAGPLRINGTRASGDFYVPLATTEAALVASYSRGAQLVTDAGGCAVVVLNEGVCRAPGFAFDTLGDAALFVAWAAESFDSLAAVARQTTRYGRLVDMQLTVEGNHAYIGFEFMTGDASGQNMATIATDAICRYIDAHAPIHPRVWFVEANMSGDKKATARSFGGVRGRKVSAEILVPGALVARCLHTTPERMEDYVRMSTLGGVMSGSIGVHGHYANGLAALFTACGQDVACVSEAAVGVTRLERRDGALYAAVTLPNLIVGTVGGGTGLPSAKASLDILGLGGPGRAAAFAELAAAVALAGELSIIGALAAGQFTDAHRRLARGAVAEVR